MRLFRRLLLCGLLFLPGTALAADFPELTSAYSADQVIETSEGDIASRVYHDEGGRQRTEMQLQGMQSVVIVRPDQQRILMVMSAMGMIMEMPFDNEMAMLNPEYRLRDYETEAVGAETMQGEQVTKYAVTDPSGRVGHVWATDDGVFVRMEGGNGREHVVVQRSNIERGPQNSALFEPPAGLPIIKVDPKMLRQMTPGVQAH